MKVTTGGISTAVGILIVGTLAVAAVLTVRDENQSGDGCEPQTFKVATREASDLPDAAVVPSDQVREQVGTKHPLPAWGSEGYVIVVVDDAKKGATPPGCLGDTPVVYVKPGRVAG